MSTFWLYLIADSNTNNHVVYHVHVDDHNEDIPIRAEKFFVEARAKNISNDIEDVTNTIRQWWGSLPLELRRRLKIYPGGEAVDPIPSAEKLFKSTNFKGAYPMLLNPKLNVL